MKGGGWIKLMRLSNWFLTSTSLYLRKKSREKARIKTYSSFPLLKESFKAHIVEIPKLEKVKQAIFVIGVTRALGKDGFLTFFF